MKGAKHFPEDGLGPGTSDGDLAVRAIKLMAQRSIELAVLDEAVAVSDERPLEQVADSSGYAVGGSALQMQAGLQGFNNSKGLTPPPNKLGRHLTLEGFAQLEVKRAVKRSIGPTRCVCWTDHANWRRQQSCENLEPKHLRWLSELLADGSEVRSLAGRSAWLGDGYSRNPEDRDQLLAQRTKDLEGLIGQLRGFSLEGFLSDASAKKAMAWSIGGDVLPEQGGSGPTESNKVAAHVTHLSSCGRKARDSMCAAGFSSELKALKDSEELRID